MPNARLEDKDLCDKWLQDDEMARCYILASMSGVLQHRHDSIKTAFEIIYNLKEMFWDQGRLLDMEPLK